MKTLIRSLVFAALVLCLPLVASANVWKSSNVGATAAVICNPSPQCHLVTIQNNGSGSVRMSFDGGNAYIDPVTGKSGNNPTATYGYLLPAGQQIVLCMPAQNAQSGAPDQGLHRPIVAILTSSTTTVLDICTDDYASTFPTS
jgi:hypothetical protein